MAEKPDNKFTQASDYFFLFCLLVFVSLVFKLVLLKDFRFLPLVGDEYRYWHNSIQILKGYFHSLNNQAPLYPIFLALIRLSFGEQALLIARIIQLVIHSLEIFLIYLLCREVFSKKIALWAGALACFYPELFSFAYLLFSETFFLGFFLGAIFLYFRAINRREAKRFYLILIAGLLNGIACLVRSVNFYFFPLWVVHLFVFFPDKLRKKILAGIFFLLAMFLPISIQTTKNYQVAHCFLLIDTNLKFNLYASHNLGLPPHSEFRLYRFPAQTNRLPCQGKNVCAEIKCELKNALNFILAHPRLTIKRTFLKILDLYSPNLFIYKNIFYEKYYRRVPLEELKGFEQLKFYQGRWFRIICSGSYLLLLLFAFWGFAGSEEKKFKAFSFFLVFYYTAVCGFFFGLTRFRMPMVPFFLIYAGIFFAQLKQWNRKKLFYQLLAFSGWLVMILVYLDRLKVLLK